MRSERKTRTRKYGAALIFLLLGTLAGAWRNRAIDHGRPDVIVGAVRTVVAPPANAIGRVSRWCSEQTGWLFRGHALARENRELKARVGRLEGENAALKEAQIDYERLRGDLGFVRSAGA